MVALYIRYGYGPWLADDTSPVLADGVFQGPDLVGHPTVDGIGLERRSVAPGENDDVYMRRVVRGDDPHGGETLGSKQS